MKYDVQFTNQFKKDLKLEEKQNKNLNKLFEVIEIFLLTVKRLMQDTKTMALQVIIKARVNATLNLIGCQFMRFGIIY